MEGNEYYGVCIPADLLCDRMDTVPTVYTDKAEVLALLKEFKGSRFKRFSSEMEALEFTNSAQPVEENKVSKHSLIQMKEYSFWCKVLKLKV